MATHTLDFEQPLVELQTRLQELRDLQEKEKGKGNVDLTKAIADLEESVAETRQRLYRNLSPWQRVQLARHPQRPYTLDYIEMLAEDWLELHGDRQGLDDHAMVGGLGSIGGQRYIIVGQQKGRSTKQRQFRNFGMPNPEGYRKALRLFQMAEKFGLPIISFIDTPGAHPGMHAEEFGQGEAIARNLREMAMLRVPVLAFVIGEGASGGALGIGVADRVYMLENTWYSVISPESCSSILWRSWDHKEQAAEALKLTADDNLRLGVADGVIEEPLGGAHHDPQAVADRIRQRLAQDVPALLAQSPQDLVNARVAKFAKLGEVHVA